MQTPANAEQTPDRTAVSKREMKWAIGVFLALFALKAFAQIKRWPEEFGDSTYFAEMVDSIRHCGRPMTHVNASMVVALEAMYSAPAKTCAMDLGYLPIINELRLHVYTIIYAIAPLSYVVPTQVLVPSLMVGSFVGLLALVYFQARRLAVPVPWAAALCALLSLHPAWKSSIFGQSYVDRLFLLTAFAYLSALSAARPRLLWIGLAGAACTAVNDRTGMLCAIITFGYLVLFPRRLMGLRLPVAIMGACFAALSYYFFHYFIINLATSFLPPLRHAFDFTDLQRRQLLLFGMAAVPLLLLAAWDWRALLLAVAMMGPNIFGNVGGAEKTGWETHYHSYYFPVLAWAALRGLAAALAWARARTAMAWRRVFLPAAAGALIAYSLTLRPHDLGIAFGVDEAAQNPWTRSLSILRDYLRPPGQRPHNIFEDVSRAIPPGATVSMIESGMPTLLYPGRTLYLMPAGIDYADYLVLNVTGRDGPRYIYADISPYTDPVSRVKLNQCLYARMRRGGFDLDHPTVFGPGYAVIKRFANPAGEGSRGRGGRL